MVSTIKPISNEKSYSYEGIFDIKQTYKYVKDFLKNSRHYDITEIEFDSKNDGDNKKIKSKIEAEQEYNDYYKIKINFELYLEGNEENCDVNGRMCKMVKGTAKIIVNSYVEADFINKRPRGEIATFLEKIYNKYIDKDEFNKVVSSVEADVAKLLERFKQSMNETV